MVWSWGEGREINKRGEKYQFYSSVKLEAWIPVATGGVAGPSELRPPPSFDPRKSKPRSLEWVTGKERIKWKARGAERRESSRRLRFLDRWKDVERQRSRTLGPDPLDGSEDNRKRVVNTTGWGNPRSLEIDAGKRCSCGTISGAQLRDGATLSDSPWIFAWDFLSSPQAELRFNVYH